MIETIAIVKCMGSFVESGSLTASFIVNRLPNTIVSPVPKHVINGLPFGKITR
jgi:hypothetical protein